MSATEYLQETKPIKTICRQQVEVSDPRATAFCCYLCILKETLLPFHPYKTLQHSTEFNYKTTRGKSMKNPHKIPQHHQKQVSCDNRVNIIHFVSILVHSPKKKIH